MKNVLMLLITMILLNCNEKNEVPLELIVDFEMTIDSEEAPATLQIKNLSEGATSYVWVFEGGSPDHSIAYDPENIKFDVAGQYKVSLTGQNENDTIEVIKDIQLLNKLTAEFEMELSNTVVPTEVNVSNMSVGANTYTWSFVGGTPENSTLENPEKVVYENPGNYQITLTISQAGREKSISKSISLTDHVVIESNWYNVDFINPGTYIFRETSSSQGNVSYLILGDEKAIMFDTGSGENRAIDGLKIKNYLDQITELPVTLLLSHFHFDHNQNISEFDHVAFPSITFLQDRVGSDGIYEFSQDELFLGSTPAEVEVDEWMPLNEEIDLGNRKIELINIPGHTDESIAIVDKTNKLVFLGDFLYSGPLYVFDLDMYETSVDYLIANISSDYRLFGAHGNPELGYADLSKLKSAISSIKNEDCSFQSNSIAGKPVEVYDCNGMQIVLFI